MRVRTDLLPSVSAVTVRYTVQNAHLGFNCNLAFPGIRPFKMCPLHTRLIIIDLVIVV